MLPLAEEPILCRWLAEVHREPARIAEDVRARPHVRFAVLDHFLQPDAISGLYDQFAHRKFSPDNEGRNYDSTSSLITSEDGIYDLLYSPAWVEWVHTALDVPQPERSGVICVARRHAPDARGFWPHVDNFPGEPKRIAILIYLSKDWSVADGGLLQFWQEVPLSGRKTGDVLHWDEWTGKRLDFLDEPRECVLELGGPGERPITRLQLVDQIVPLYNRAVLIALDSPAIHSVSPSRGKERCAILQWLC